MRVARRPNEKRIVRRAAEKQVRRSLVLGLRVKTNEAPRPRLNQAFPRPAQLEVAAGAIGAVHRHSVCGSRDWSEGQAAVQIVGTDIVVAGD